LIFLLDTNVVSEFRKKRPHGAVVAWYKSYSPSAFAIPSIAFFELQIGAEMTRKQDDDKAREIETWIETVLRSATVLSLDATAARETARLIERHSWDLIGDGMIAAIARVNGLTVATRNIRDFKHFEVSLVNPFDYKE
jgi:predicted nucleic acid-binding protein